MQPRSSFALLGSCLLLLFIAATHVATAEPSFNCPMVWKGAKKDNNVLSCLNDSSRIRSQMKYYAVPILLAITAVLVIFIVPVGFIFNWFCCEEYCFNFTRTTNLARSRCWLWMAMSINLVWSICSAILIIYGSILLKSTADKSADYITNDAIHYFNETKNTIASLLTDYSVSPPAPPFVDLSGFSLLDNRIKAKIDYLRDNYFLYFSVTRTTAIIVGTLGIALICSSFIIAYRRLNVLCAFVFSFIYYFFAIVYLVISVLFSIFSYIVFASCGEVTLQNRREPGIFQWYVIPWCEDQYSFSSTRNQVASKTKGMAQDTCAKVLEYCTNDESEFIEKPFVCGNKISSSDECDTLEKTINVLQNTYAKPIFADTLCVNMTGWEYRMPCNIPECANRCTDYEKPHLPAKSWATEVVKFFDFAVNRTTALSYVLPVMDCNFIIDKFISVYQIEKNPISEHPSGDFGLHCSNLRIASVMLVVGFFIGSFMFIISIYVMQHGIWMWNDDAEVEDLKEAKAMSRYAKSIYTTDSKKNLSRAGPFVFEQEDHGLSKEPLADKRRMSFNQMNSLAPAPKQD